jgi:uncharacterized membrane protein
MMDDRNDEAARSSPHDELLELHDAFEQSASPMQRAAGRVIYYLAAPVTALGVAILAVAWMVFNLVLGRRAVDPPPFAALEALATVAALITTILILAGQRREDQAAEQRARLTLHLVAQSEQKIAKLIELMEEQRRDSVAMHDRPDLEAARMASPAAPKELLQRLERKDGS